MYFNQTLQSLGYYIEPCTARPVASAQARRCAIKPIVSYQRVRLGLNGIVKCYVWRMTNTSLLGMLKSSKDT
jgi:hypothetical protein